MGTLTRVGIFQARPSEYTDIKGIDRSAFHKSWGMHVSLKQTPLQNKIRCLLWRLPLDESMYPFLLPLAQQWNIPDSNVQSKSSFPRLVKLQLLSLKVHSKLMLAAGRKWQREDYEILNDFDRLFDYSSHRKAHTNGRNKSQHCCVLLANNVASVCRGLKVWPVSNYTQQVPTLLWFHANGRNMSGPTMLCPFVWALMVQTTFMC